MSKTKIENPFTPMDGFEGDGSDFSSLIREYFGKDHPALADFSFNADELLGHDETESYSPTGDVDEDELAEILSGEKSEYCSHMLMEKLVADGFIEAGTYYIETC